MKQWQPLGWDRWWMEGSWWLCWVAAHSLYFSSSALPIQSLSLCPFLPSHPCPSIPSFLCWWVIEGGSVLPPLFLPATQGVSISCILQLFGPCTIYRTAVGQMRVRAEETHKQSHREMDKEENRKLERDGGTDSERGSQWEKSQRERKGSQKQLKRWDEKQSTVNQQSDIETTYTQNSS